MSTISSYLQIANNLSKWQDITAKEPEVAVQTKYFQDNIGKVQSADDLVNDTRLFTYAMDAFGMSDMTYAKGLIKKVLQQGVSSSTSLAHTLNNPRILAFAQAFDFAGGGVDTSGSSNLVASVTSRYTENALETDQGKQNPGVQLALYFQQNAPKITSVYGILADKNLLTVVQTALDISPLTAAEPVDTQYAMLSAKLKVSDFQDPQKLQNFITRFAAMYDANNSDPSNPSYDGGDVSNAVLLDASMAGSDGIIGIDQNLLLQASSHSFSALG